MWGTSVLVLASLSGTAIAQTGDPAAAAELFRQGRDALRQQQYLVACPKFAESMRLDPKVGTLINLAQCEEATGRLASALRHWSEAQVLARSLGDGREAFATQKHDALAPRVPHLVVRLAAGGPGDVRVTVDGLVIGPGDLGALLSVDVGSHSVVVSAEGHADASSNVITSEGLTAELPVDVGPIVASPPAPPASSAKGDGLTGPRASLSQHEVPFVSANRGAVQRWIGYAVGGAGIVGLGLGTAWGVQAINAKNAPGCQNGVCGTTGEAQVQRDGHDAGDRATVAFIAGGALLAGGVALWLAAPSGRSAALTVTAGGGAATVGLGGAW